MPVSETICVVGIKGSGKTHLVKTEIIPVQSPLLIYDTIGEYRDIPNLAVPESEFDLLDLIEFGDDIRVEFDSDIEFDRVCYFLKKLQYRYTLIVDEFHTLYEHHMSFQRDVPNFKPLVLLGNHNNISIVLITQRPTDLPQYVLSQTDTLYSFHVWHDADIKFISQILDNPEQLRGLGLYEYKKIEFISPITITEGRTEL